jgi:sulfide:quinone oxidoreductase
MAHYQVLIVGGGAAGITAAAQLKRARPQLAVAILEPSAHHDYQPGWTLVGAGVFSLDETRRSEGDLIPSGVTWIRDAVASFQPEANQLTTTKAAIHSYDALVVATGMKLCWDQIKGLPEALGSGGVCSNYSRDHAAYTWEAIQAFQGSKGAANGGSSANAVFTCAPMPIKCPGAPQKIAYLADDVFKRKRLGAKVIYATATPGIFGVPTYAAPLREVVARKGIDARYNHVLTEVRPDTKEAIFRVTDGESSREEVITYGMLHVTPPMAAPDVVAQSSLAAANGFVEVDQYSLQHLRFANVFSLGDVSGMPNSKTAAAVRGQAPVLTANLLALLDGGPLEAAYDGYSCCPLITGYGKTIMAEFNYKQEPTPSFPLDPTKERWSMWFVKRKVLPSLYWNRMLTGALHERRFIPGAKG